MPRLRETEDPATSRVHRSGAEPLVVHARDAHEEGDVLFSGLIVIEPLEGVGFDVDGAEAEKEEFVETREGFIAEALFSGGGLNKMQNEWRNTMLVEQVQKLASFEAEQDGHEPPKTGAQKSAGRHGRAPGAQPGAHI